ncbi:hypothetical protein NBM05_08525 [Rothia sp. AR01]|uniref:Uncharacterized protein n=1 Tax=Rothia santali TaxID=2949643 RepID=A0A9X2HHZ2_9MICC|nr:hypothetical protein [Rothia santali]MCP3426046.1 hypothetical protein [Rothia santali]
MFSPEQLLPGAIGLFIGSLIIIGIGIYMLQNILVVSLILFLMAVIALTASAAMYRAHKKR